MALVIPDAVLERAELTAQELLIDLACYLFDKRRLSFGKAKELAGKNHLEFQQELALREIDFHYDEGDLAIDLENLGIIL